MGSMSEADTSNTETTNEGPSPEIIQEAESQGWRPKDKFLGHESDWVDADVFVKRGREILPILRKNNENLMKELNGTREQLKEFRQAAEEFKQFQKENYERKAAALEAQIKEIKESRAQAISDGDGKKVNDLDDALDEAKDDLKEAKQAARKAEAAPAPAPAPTQLDPALQSWLDKNKWFGDDRRLTGIANGIGESLRFENPGLKGQAFLDKLDEVLAEEFPAKFGKSNRTNGSRVESGAGRQPRASSTNNGRSYENLPPDAKAACDKFTKQKLMTKEQYVQDYAWDE